MKTWTFPGARPKISGPWDDEPDKAQWVDETTDLDCLIVRNRMGALCGYVGLPPGHRLYGEDYEKPDVDVHGGLTFASKCQEGREDGWGICHVPLPGRPAEVWWFGFDCAHAFDLVPSMLVLAAEIPDYPTAALDRDVYRPFEYVKAEVTSLAAQLADHDR